MCYQMRTIQKISKTRSGVVKQVYTTEKKPEPVIPYIYEVHYGNVDYRSGIWDEHRVIKARSEREARSFKSNIETGPVVFNSVYMVRRYQHGKAES